MLSSAWSLGKGLTTIGINMVNRMILFRSQTAYTRIMSMTTSDKQGSTRDIVGFDPEKFHTFANEKEQNREL